MPITWSIHEEENLYVERWRGTVDLDEALAVIDETAQDPRYVAGMNGIVDLRDSNVSWNEDAVRQIFEKMMEYQEKHRGWRWALLARSPQQLSVAALYVSISQGTPDEIAVIQEDAEAVEWLGLTAAGIPG